MRFATSPRALLCAALLLPLAATASAQDHPTRKPGLWEMTTRYETDPKPSIAHQCIDVATDKAMILMGQGMAQQMCEKMKARREGDKFITEQTCQVGRKMKVHARSVMSGDYNKAYTVETQSTFDPPMGAIKQNNSTLQARWVGPCKAGQKPGDIITDDGMTINILDMIQLQK